jgi:hypothetical protein
MYVRSTQYPIARKEHTCNWCSQKIQIGEAYRKQTIFAEGSAYTWKNHRHCDALADRLEMFENYDNGDGLSKSDFWDCITEEFRNIMYEKDKTIYNSKFPMPEFSERMKVVRVHHDL